LLLGAKFVGAPSVPVLKACGEYNEVVSLDWYPYVQYPIADLPFFSQVYAAAKRPLLVGEFSYRGNVRVLLQASARPGCMMISPHAHIFTISRSQQDTGLPNTKGAGLVVKTQALRAEGYKNFTTTLAQLPYIVGLHWFAWNDQPVEGRQLDGENSNYGVVNIHGTRLVLLLLLQVPMR
jgi:agarase